MNKVMGKAHKLLEEWRKTRTPEDLMKPRPVSESLSRQPKHWREEVDDLIRITIIGGIGVFFGGAALLCILAAAMTVILGEDGGFEALSLAAFFSVISVGFVAAAYAIHKY